MTAADVQTLKTVDNIKTAIELGQGQNLASDVAKLTAIYIAVGAVFEPVKYLPLLFIKHKSRGNTQWKVTGRLAH